MYTRRTDGDLATTFVSPGVEAVLGYSPEEYLSGPEFRLGIVHPDDREAVKAAQQRADASGGQLAMEYRVLSKDGRLVWLRDEAVVVGDEDGRPPFWHGVMLDVTGQKRTELELEESEERFRALVQNSLDFGATLDAEEICAQLVRAAERVERISAATVTVWEGDGQVAARAASGPEELLDLASTDPEVVAAREGAVADGEYRVFRVGAPGGELTGACLPFKGHGRVAGVLEVYGFDPPADGKVSAFLESLVNQAATALENARLYAELEERERRLQELLAKLLGAQEEERRRVAYEVHDGLAQVAAAAHQHLQAFARRNAPEREEVRAELNLVVKLVRRTVTDARRIIANLRPTALDDFGLSAAVSLEVEKLQEEGYEVEYIDEVGEERLPDACEITLYRIAQESIANLRKHADTERVKVEIRRSGDEAHLEVKDWGSGFEPEEVSAGSGPGERVGLVGMRERAGMLGGMLEIRSAPGEGTAVVATIPIGT